MIRGRDVFHLLRSSMEKWSAHNAPRLGAALAFYALLSLAPLLILAVAICGLVFSKTAAEQNLLMQLEQIFGASSTGLVRALIENSRQTQSGVVASISAVITLFFGASGVFVELRDSLNLIWDARCRYVGWRGMLWQRLFSFGMVLALGFLLLGSLILSTWLGFVGKLFGGFASTGGVVAGELYNALISFAAVTILCALIFKFVPDAEIHWRDVLIGAMMTSALFGIGRALLALYLRTAGTGSAYGAAGSLVVLVVWVYYSAQIFFFGAVLTRVYADRFGSRVSPTA